MEKEQQTYTLDEVVFYYLINKKKDPVFKDVKFDELKKDSVEDNIRESFRNLSKTFSGYLMEIVNFLGIKDPFTKCNKSNVGYAFYKEDVEFLAELIFRYTHKKCVDGQEDDIEISIWKGIRKIIGNWSKEQYIKGMKEDAIVAFYKNSGGEELFNQIQFIVQGFLDFYKRQVGEDTDRYDDYKAVLLLNTSYYKLECIQNLSNTIYDALPISWKEIEMTKVGILQKDYELEIRDLTARIREIVDMKNEYWESKKEKRIIEYKEYITDETVQIAQTHLFRKMIELDHELGMEIVMENAMGLEPSDEKTKDKRKKLYEKALAALDIEDRYAIGKITSFKDL